MNLWTVGGADPRLTAQARSPIDESGKTRCVSPICPQVGGAHKLHSTTATTGVNLIPGKVEPSAVYQS